MTRAVVLGAGRVGATIARDLAHDTEVRAVDAREEALARLADDGIETAVADLTGPRAVLDVVEDADVAVSVVPGRMGLHVLEVLIGAGIPTVDVSFTPESPLVLDPVARDRGVPAVVDCGFAPGLSNLLVGRATAELDEVDEVRILAGGLPARPVGPWGYRVVFSPADLIEVYVRPCRMRVDGEAVVVPALGEVEEVEVEGIGTLEAFCTDGLRTLLETIPARTMVEKTLRWPGHADKVRALAESGFFDEDPIEAGGVPVSPRAVSEALLSRAWARPDGEEEVSILLVEVEGTRGGRRERIAWDLVDRTDPETGTTSMARTTGYPAAAVARLLASGAWDRPGVHPPEVLGRDAAVAGTILDELGRRGVRVSRRETAV